MYRQTKQPVNIRCRRDKAGFKHRNPVLSTAWLQRSRRAILVTHWALVEYVIRPPMLNQTNGSFPVMFSEMPAPDAGDAGRFVWRS
jgi:hypothetical protein